MNIRKWYYRTFWLKSITKKIRALDGKRGYHDARGVMSQSASYNFEVASANSRLANKYRKKIDKLRSKI